MAERSVNQTTDVIAVLSFDGVGVIGAVKNETRTVTGMTVTNNLKKPVSVEIEEEASKQAFSATIQPGETATLTTKPLVQWWNPEHGGLWDGLNILWRIPAQVVR